MNPHSIHNVLPELFAAFLVNRLVADNGEFVGPRRNKNKDGVALAGFVNSEALKFFLCNDQRIAAQFAALNKDANLAGSFRFGFTNRAHDSFVFELAEKFFGSHFATNCRSNRRPQNFHLHRQTR